jgi:hypothetical protein
MAGSSRAARSRIGAIQWINFRLDGSNHKEGPGGIAERQKIGAGHGGDRPVTHSNLQR